MEIAEKRGNKYLRTVVNYSVAAIAWCICRYPLFHVSILEKKITHWTIESLISFFFLSLLIWNHIPLLCYRRATACTCDGAPRISVCVCVCALTKKLYLKRESLFCLLIQVNIDQLNKCNAQKCNAREAPGARLHHIAASQSLLFFRDVRVILMKAKHLSCTN